MFAEFNLQDGKIVVKPSEEDRDGFIAKLLPPEGSTIGIKLNVGFSTTQGVYFGGSGGAGDHHPDAHPRSARWRSVGADRA